LPKLKAFYEANSHLRDKFEILALHESGSVKTFAELDPKIAKHEAEIWKGKLPFPVLIDAPNEVTTKRYGIEGYPTIILIDPEGKIVKGGSLEMLKEKIGAK
jgi:hypothetical protein